MTDGIIKYISHSRIVYKFPIIIPFRITNICIIFVLIKKIL